MSDWSPTWDARVLITVAAGVALAGLGTSLATTFFDGLLFAASGAVLTLSGLLVRGAVDRLTPWRGRSGGRSLAFAFALFATSMPIALLAVPAAVALLRALEAMGHPGTWIALVGVAVCVALGVRYVDRFADVLATDPSWSPVETLRDRWDPEREGPGGRLAGFYDDLREWIRSFRHGDRETAEAALRDAGERIAGADRELSVAPGMVERAALYVEEESYDEATRIAELAADAAATEAAVRRALSAVRRADPDAGSDVDADLIAARLSAAETSSDVDPAAAHADLEAALDLARGIDGAGVGSGGDGSPDGEFDRGDATGPPAETDRSTDADGAKRTVEEDAHH